MGSRKRTQDEAVSCLTGPERAADSTVPVCISSTGTVRWEAVDLGSQRPCLTNYRTHRREPLEGRRSTAHPESARRPTRPHPLRAGTGEEGGGHRPAATRGTGLTDLARFKLFNTPYLNTVTAAYADAAEPDPTGGR
jgi:hypothetical protein